ncbi:hypothetical protein D3C75_675660 [compost metagenome]
MGQRLLDQRIDGDVVLHVAAIVEDAVLAVGGERVEGHVGDDAQLRKARTQGAGGALGQAVRIPGLLGEQRLLLQRGDREQRQRRNAQRNALGRLLEQQVDGQALDPRHRRHRLATVLALQHEHRQDQIVGGQHVLAHQTAGELVATIAAQAGGGEQAIGGGKAHGALQARDGHARQSMKKL